MPRGPRLPPIRRARARTQGEAQLAQAHSTSPSLINHSPHRAEQAGGWGLTEKQAVDEAEEESFTLYVFDSLELRRAQFGEGFAEGGASTVTDYEVSTWTVVPYLLESGVRLARIVYEPGSGLAGASSTDDRHVFFELGDHLGSTSVVLDQATSELVERSTYQAYGGAESTYRPTRWRAFREDYRFTGKEEDVEVGLQYFGKRYLNPLLGRWISADPLAVHAPGEADLNLYAYVSGGVLKNVDPLGLEEADPFSDPNILAASEATWQAKQDAGVLAEEASQGEVGLGTDLDGLGTGGPMGPFDGEQTRAANEARVADPNDYFEHQVPRFIHSSWQRDLDTMNDVAREQFYQWTFRIQKDLGIRVMGNGSAGITLEQQQAKFGRGRGPDGEALKYAVIVDGVKEEFTLQTTSNAQIGYHPFGAAADPYFADAATEKPVAWGGPVYKAAAEYGREFGLKWGNDFEAVRNGSMKPDPQHFEYSGGVSPEEMSRRAALGLDIYSGQAVE